MAFIASEVMHALCCCLKEKFFSKKLKVIISRMYYWQGLIECKFSPIRPEPFVEGVILLRTDENFCKAFASLNITFYDMKLC